MHVEGLIEFENSIPVDNSCLGKQYRIKVGDVRGIFETPVVGVASDESNFGFKLNRPHASKILIEENTRWGDSSAGINFSYLRAASVYFKIKQQNIDTVKDELFVALITWVKHFVENLCVLSGFDLIPPDKNTSEQFGLKELNRYNLSFTKKKKPFKIQASIVLTLFSPIYTKGCSLNDFEIALRTASDQKRPLLEYYFLLDSNRAVHDGNYRKSILDAATALEICFSNSIEDHLPPNQSLKQEILKTYNSLSKKRKLLKSLNVQLPDKNYQADIEEVRNRAIHRGYQPSVDEARKAYSLTKETLDYLIQNKFE